MSMLYEVTVVELLHNHIDRLHFWGGALGNYQISACEQRELSNNANKLN